MGAGDEVSAFWAEAGVCEPPLWWWWGGGTLSSTLARCCSHAYATRRRTPHSDFNPTTLCAPNPHCTPSAPTPCAPTLTPPPPYGKGARQGRQPPKESCVWIGSLTQIGRVFLASLDHVFCLSVTPPPPTPGPGGLVGGGGYLGRVYCYPGWSICAILFFYLMLMLVRC